MQRDEHEVIRQYVREALLREFEDEAGYGVPAEDMYDVFIKPFVTFGGVAAAELKKTGRRAWTTVNVATEAILSSLIPFLSADFDDIWKKHESAIDAIESKYSKYYEEVEHVLSHGDAWASAFLYAPLAFFTAPVIRRVPKLFMSSMERFSGKESPVTHFVDRVKRSYGDSGYDFDIASLGEGKLTEAKRPIEDVLTQKKLLRALAASPRLKQISGEMQAAVNAQLSAVVKRARAIASAKTLGDLQGLVGKPLKGADNLKKLPEQERGKAEQALLERARAASKKLYVESIKKRIEQATSSGVPSSSPFIVAHKRAVEQISGL